jgi:hypothetical protein
MTEENSDKLLPAEGEAKGTEQQPAKVELPAEFVAAQAQRAAKAPTWDRDPRPGKWTTIGCGIGLVLLIAALFAGSSLLRKTVWAGFVGTGNRLIANLPGDLPPGERMRLTRNLDRFTTQVKQQDDPYEAMGEFQKLARKAMEDRLITHEEVEEINVFLESHLPNHDAVPYSMP